jgi:hypothetical protein
LRGQARYRIERTTLAFRRRHSSRPVGAMLLDAVHLPLTRRKTDCRRSIAEATRRARPLRRGLLEHNIAAEQAAAVTTMAAVNSRPHLEGSNGVLGCSSVRDEPESTKGLRIAGWREHESGPQ